MQLIENRPIGCLYCGYGPVNGKEESRKDPRTGDIIHECNWVCPRCMRLSRTDSRVEKVVKPEVIKEAAHYSGRKGDYEVEVKNKKTGKVIRSHKGWSKEDAEAYAKDKNKGDHVASVKKASKNETKK